VSVSVAIVGGGWAGLAAAVEATARGHTVTLYEMAPALGGRARRLPPGGVEGLALDNGQHILIGAYTETLRLMRTVGVDPAHVLQRLPLTLLDAQGRGLRLPPGAPLAAFVRGVLAARGWTLGERLALLRTAAGWLARGFRCDERLTVAELAAALPAAVRQRLIDPLCVAALNTPADQASAQVFLRVLHQALFAGRGASDLLLPRVDLGALLPDAAAAWLASRGVRIETGHRVEALVRDGDGWRLDGARHDRVVLACSATEAARLAEPHAPAWAATARALRHEPIVTVLLRAPATAVPALPAPMVALDPREDAPAQYVFDLGQLRDPAREPGAAGVLAFVISGAARCVERGAEATTRDVQAQAAQQIPALRGCSPELLRVITEKRATFLCLPRLARPAATVAASLLAAGDYVMGDYPATLEGAVRSGIAAATAR
jgi:squalene-associated FAD-dependent desaturase